MAQTQIDETSSPTITILTTICADQNRPQIERSAVSPIGWLVTAGVSVGCCAKAAASGMPISNAARAKDVRRRSADCAILEFIENVLLCPIMIGSETGFSLSGIMRHSRHRT